MSTVLANKIYLNQLFAMVISKRNITGRQTDNHWGLQQIELAVVNQLKKLEYDKFQTLNIGI